jgi:hypothetical protein
MTCLPILSIKAPSRLLKKTQPAQYYVENRPETAGPRSGKLRVHRAFSSILALFCAPKEMPLGCALKEVPLGRARLSLF